jgi:hypothetical protein
VLSGRNNTNLQSVMGWKEGSHRDRRCLIHMLFAPSKVRHKRASSSTEEDDHQRQFIYVRVSCCKRSGVNAFHIPSNKRGLLSGGHEKEKIGMFVSQHQ